MKDKSERSGPERSTEIARDETPLRPQTPEEERVWAAFEQARQDVKAVVEREMEAERVDADLLNLRLRAR